MVWIVWTGWRSTGGAGRQPPYPLCADDDPATPTRRLVSSGSSTAVAPPGDEASRAAPDGRAGSGRAVGRDIVLTTLSQAAIALGGLALYRLLAVKKGAEGVAAYSLVKQTVYFVWPLVMVGMQTAIPRYVALARGRAGAVEGQLLAAVALTGTTTAALSVLALVSPHTTASLLFGNSARTNLVFPLVATLIATVAMQVMYGYFRGHSRFIVPNAVQVLGVAALPVVLLAALGGRPIGELISLMAAGVLAGSLLALSRPLLRALRSSGRGETRAAARTLLNYGSRRVPGELASVVLLSVPPVVAAHFVPLRQVAYLTTGLYVLAMVAIAFQPIGMVFLPLLTRLCAVDFDAARRHVAQLAACSIHLAIFVTPQFVLFADVAIRVWLGHDFDRAGTIISIVVLPAGLYAVNVILRSALDAAAVTAYNARNYVASTAVAAAAAAASLATHLAHPLNCIAWSFALGVVCLGALTMLSVARVYRLSVRSFSLPLAVALGTLTAAAGFLVDRTVVRGHATLANLGLVAGLEVVLGALFLGSLVRAGVTWPAELRARVRRRGDG